MLELFLSRFDRINDDAHLDVAIIYAGGYFPNSNRMARALQDEYNKNLRPDEVIIPVAITKFQDAKSKVREGRDLPRLIQNNPKVRYYLCAFNLEGEQCDSVQLIIENSRIVFKEGQNNPFIPFHKLTRQVITEMYRKYSVENNHQTNFHYIKPSEKHTNFFLRASKMFRSSIEISFFALAALNHFPKNEDGTPFIPSHILIDTPIIIALAQAIVDLLKLISGNEIPTIEINSFGSFTGLNDEEYSSAILSELPETTLALISASTSGGLAKELQKSLKLPESHFLHFLYLSATLREDVSFPKICNLYQDKVHNANGFIRRPQNFNAENCKLCTGGSFAIRLLGDHFDPAPPKPQPVKIGRNDAPTGIDSFRELIGRTVAQNIFKVGTTKAYRDKTHRHFYVDASLLLENEKIKERLHYNLDVYFPQNPQAIIHIDKYSNRFAEEIKEYTKCENVDIISHDDIESHLPNATNSKKPIIVCAAIIESGRTLLEVSRDLRNIVTGAPIIYFILLAKSFSSEKMDALRSNLSMTSAIVQHNVVIIEEFPLPVSTKHNGWHLEEEFITTNKLNNRRGSYWVQRHSKVAITDGTMPDPLFLRNSKASKSKLTLQNGFVFFPSGGQLAGKSSDADIYFCIASVLQNLRTRQPSAKKTSLMSSIYHQGLLSAENFSRYNDNILQACLLRAALPAELNYVEHKSESREMTRLIKRILISCDRKRGAAAMEFLFALGCGKLKLQHAHLVDIFEIDKDLIPESRVRELFSKVKSILLTKKTSFGIL